MTLERWQHHCVIFTQKSVGLLVKSVDFCFLLLYMPMVTSKMGGEHFSFFFQACNSSKQISLCLFRFWVLTNFSFGIFILKALFGHIPAILQSQYCSRSKLLNCTHFSGHKPNVGHFAIS